MKILFGADLVPTEATEALFINGDAEALFGNLLPVFGAADRFIVNLECALTRLGDEAKIKKFGPNLKGAPECINGIKAIGVTDILLSNNHCLDYGVRGLRDTAAALDAAGLPYTGIGENDTESRKIYYFEQEGKRFSIVNVCEHEYTYALPNRMGANPFDPFLTMQDIREAKSNSDFCITVYHGGKEYCRYPSPRLKNLCREMVYCGADIVLCQHSHCIGCYEKFEGGHIVYGQGNFNFVKESTQSGWYTALLVEADFGEKLNGLKFYPMYMTDSGMRLAEGERAEEIMAGFEKRSEELGNGKWLDGWRAFCQSPELHYYVDNVKRFGNPEDITPELAREAFANYLDCEAHTDVWRELFKTWNNTNCIDK